MKKPVIEIQNLSFSYRGHPILKNVNLKINERSFVAMIGPNGGGKTTLLKLMLGLLEPDSGIVSIFGESPQHTAHRIGYVPQEIGINKSFPISVMDVVLMGKLRTGRGWSRHSRNDRNAAEKVLEELEMWELRDRRIGELSGGQRQRVFIARALVNDPEILFLDEPTANVDSKGQTEFYEVLKKLNETAAIIMVSHELMVISSYVKSVACVNENVHYHNAAEITEEMIDMFCCPVELVTHGKVPHRVLRKHEDF
ncbi:metal ABC transporter ATP-binding protein [Desulfonema magnum]|uniref:Zinc ABC transporter, ATP-binding protein n=1 Tax=Desulfonema magnum TaxID=45655 RepID=A0A975GSD5_9BACT|nr:metal ABC transporter ATP-binding protein [Desulfonema magnum]QTA91919.1 Zinc ABC transporter, ATP-binding protein [Desulfonema magnum]